MTDSEILQIFNSDQAILNYRARLEAAYPFCPHVVRARANDIIGEMEEHGVSEEKAKEYINSVYDIKWRL